VSVKAVAERLPFFVDGEFNKVARTYTPRGQLETTIADLTTLETDQREGGS